MELLYLKMVFHIKYRLWNWWHCELPYRVYRLGRRKECRMCGSRTEERDQRWLINSRPWWHLCCNGDAGGWRTDVCNWLEGYRYGWRGLEERVYPHRFQSEAVRDRLRKLIEEKK